LDPLVEAGHELVEPEGDRPFSHEKMVEQASGVDAIVCLLTDQIDDAVLTAGSPRLKVVATVAVGHDNIDLDAAAAHGIAVTNTPAVLDDTTADLAFLLILAAARRIWDAESDLRAGKWPGWDIDQYLGRDVHGAVLGVVGFGRIGQAVARRATGFGMEVLHHTRRDTDIVGWRGDLDRLLAESDIVTLHVPLTDETRHLIDARRLALMKPDAVLVNTSRGPVVDETALVSALREGRIFAALDVYDTEPLPPDNPFRDLPNTVLTPHLGFTTVEGLGDFYSRAVDNIVAYLDGHPKNVANPEALKNG
jgi:lactate dehydrogenase-like 2-hydroxyacid dehydrogenase